MRATLIVPCYNEADRLDDTAFLSLISHPADLNLLFVDDGSTDTTLDRLHRIRAQAPAGTGVFRLDRNQGKAEAVRLGLLHALAEGADVVGYADADLATPPDEIVRLYDILRDSGAAVVIGSRIVLLGRKVERSPARHCLGRLFSIAGSLALRQRLYDTQCGAKFFRRTPALEIALREPFASRWAFDVELLGRLLIAPPGTEPVAAADLREEPLLTWRDVPGSKLRARQMIRALYDLARIGQDLRRRRATRRSSRRVRLY